MGLNEKFFKSEAAGPGFSPSDYFAPVLYSGNNTAKTVSVGFAPD